MDSKKEVDDRFHKFGTVSFTAVSRVNDFISRLEAGEVAGTRCKECGKAFFPPRADCRHCLTGDMEWFAVAGEGKLLSYSRLTFAPTGFEEDVPYHIALADYGEYKIFGRMADKVPEEEITVGMAVKTVVNHLPGGRLNYVFEKGSKGGQGRNG